MFDRFALFVATVSTASAVFVATLPVYPCILLRWFDQIDNKPPLLESISGCRTPSMDIRNLTYSSLTRYEHSWSSVLELIMDARQGCRETSLPAISFVIGFSLTGSVAKKYSTIRRYCNYE